MKPLEAIVRAYLSKHAEREEGYLEFYREQKTLSDAVAKAAMAELPDGRQHPHQRRLPSGTLIQAKDALLRADLSIAKTFDQLHAIVDETLAPIAGIGLLTIYDTAHRIGAHLGLHPECVYLHAGVRAGAKALGLDHRAKKISMDILPKELQRLRPEQVEDCLCIYKGRLADIEAEPCINRKAGAGLDSTDYTNLSYILCKSEGKG